MLIYQISITILLLVPFSIAIANLFGFAAIRRRDRPQRTPPVSVLVPARDEERSIASCLRSLLDQDYPDCEVIVLNDGSTDRTPEILEELARRDPRLRAIRGEELPAGWVGKNWACRQLAAAAGGEILIFTDADTRHEPESIAACVAFMQREEIEFLSGVPRMVMLTFWERVIVPMTQFLYFAYLPNRWITTKRDPRFSAANGQLLCITRKAYDRIGGHAAVRSSLIEDMALIRLAKSRGVPSALASAVETVECRMYGSLGQIVSGFSKNLLAGLGGSLTALALFVASMLALYVLPLFFAAAMAIDGIFSAALFWLPLTQLLLGSAIRGMMAARFRMGPGQLPHQPLSAAMAVAIAINSLRWSRSNGGARWKGRRYDPELSRRVS